jgi:hypothetical protein
VAQAQEIPHKPLLSGYKSAFLRANNMQVVPMMPTRSGNLSRPFSYYWQYKYILAYEDDERFLRLFRKRTLHTNESFDTITLSVGLRQREIIIRVFTLASSWR